MLGSLYFVCYYCGCGFFFLLILRIPSTEKSLKCCVCACIFMLTWGRTENEIKCEFYKAQYSIYSKFGFLHFLAKSLQECKGLSSADMTLGTFHSSEWLERTQLPRAWPVPTWQRGRPRWTPGGPWEARCAVSCLVPCVPDPSLHPSPRISSHRFLWVPAQMNLSNCWCSDFFS